MGYKKGYYRKDGTYVNGYFTNSNSKRGTSKNNNGCLVIIMIVALVLTISCSENSKPAECPSKKCSDFSSQAQAQSVYDSDRNCYSNLDADNDETACENLPN